MRAKELLNGGWRGRLCCGGSDGLEEGEEVLSGLDWEEGSRVGDYVGVFVRAEVEAEADSSGRGIGIGVRDVGDSSRVGESCPSVR